MNRNTFRFRRASLCVCSGTWFDLGKVFLKFTQITIIEEENVKSACILQFGGARWRSG